MIRKLILTVTLFFSSTAFALVHPQQTTYDSRIRYVTYNSEDVVQINTVLGIATHIQIDPNENYVTHVFGDSKAYAFAMEGNHIFIKPAGEKADTNMIVVTDKRNYNFRLTFRSDRNNAVYQIAFIYPDKVQQELETKRQQQNIEQAFLEHHGRFNLLYSMSGDLDLAPQNVWDDGVMTYFKFAGNSSLPEIYMVDEDGQEVRVNRTTTGRSNNIIVEHFVSTKWRIRLGNRVLSVWNEAPQTNSDILNETGTVSPTVRRIPRGEK